MQPVLFILLVFMLAISCRERYGLPMEKSLSNSLVVEGNILKGDTTVVKLSRVSDVADQNLAPETGATVTVEGDDNSSYQLSESEPGVYKVSPINLQSSAKYRLKISAGGKDYESTWTSVINTSEIDSVYWVRDNGIEIFVKSSGNSDDSKYYKWDYDEVWDFYSITTSHIFFNLVRQPSGEFACDSQEVDGVKYEKCLEQYIWRGYIFNDSMYHCWKYNSSGKIHIGSTTVLSDNVVLAPIRKIEDNGFELSNTYSILVKQTGLSKEAYEFYKILGANSEGKGSIFDAQPSQLKTNLRCTSDPGETVIGFIDATSVKSRRIFIKNEELEGWVYYPYAECSFSRDTISDLSIYQVNYLVQQDLVPVAPLETPKPPLYSVGPYIVMSEFCMDCRARGVHKKPDFWPN